MLLCVWTVALGFILAGMYVVPLRKYRVAVAGILLIVFAGAFAELEIKKACIGNEAVVVAKTADARFGPLAEATTHFTLYEGTKVRILSSQGAWKKIRRADGKTGWIKRDKIAIF